MDDIVKKIQVDILNQDVSLSSILYSAKVLAYHLKNPEFIQWVNSETDGYYQADDLPDYRILTPISTGTFRDRVYEVKNHMIPVSMLGDDWLVKRVTTFPVAMSVRALEELANSPNTEQRSPWPNELVQILNAKNIFNMICTEAFFVFNTFNYSEIIAITRSRLLDFVLEIGGLEWHIGEPPPPNEIVQNLVEVKIYNVQGDNMPTFDQRGQNVNYQYNAAGNINFDAVTNQANLIAELGKLKQEIESAKQAGAINEDIAFDAQYEVQKAIQAAKKPEPDKSSFMDHIGKAKKLLEDGKAAVGLVTALIQAADLAQNLF